MRLRCMLLLVRGRQHAKLFKTVNGVPGHGGALDVGGPIVAGGMLFVNSEPAQRNGGCTYSRSMRHSGNQHEKEYVAANTTALPSALGIVYRVAFGLTQN